MQTQEGGQSRDKVKYSGFQSTCCSHDTELGDKLVICFSFWPLSSRGNYDRSSVSTPSCFTHSCLTFSNTPTNISALVSLFALFFPPHLLYPKQNQEVRGTNILLANQKKKIHLLFFSSISLDQPVPVLNSLPFSTATVYDHGWSWCYILYHNFNRKFDCISLPVILKHCYPPPIYLSALLLHRDVGPSASSSLLSSKSDTICPCTFIPVTPKPSYQLRKERYANISKCKLSI